MYASTFSRLWRLQRSDYGWIRDRITPERIATVRKLIEVARDLSPTTAQLAIACLHLRRYKWILRRKEISSVITGATRLEQLKENILAAEAEEKPTDDVLERIEQIQGNQPEE